MAAQPLAGNGKNPHEITVRVTVIVIVIAKETGKRIETKTVNEIAQRRSVTKIVIKTVILIEIGIGIEARTMTGKVGAPDTTDMMTTTARATGVVPPETVREGTGIRTGMPKRIRSGMGTGHRDMDTIETQIKMTKSETRKVDEIEKGNTIHENGPTMCLRLSEMKGKGAPLHIRKTGRERSVTYTRIDYQTRERKR
jgi:hypothetical protein